MARWLNECRTLYLCTNLTMSRN